MVGLSDIWKKISEILGDLKEVNSRLMQLQLETFSSLAEITSVQDGILTSVDSINDDLEDVLDDLASLLVQIPGIKGVVDNLTTAVSNLQAAINLVETRVMQLKPLLKVVLDLLGTLVSGAEFILLGKPELLVTRAMNWLRSQISVESVGESSHDIGPALKAAMSGLSKEVDPT